MATDPRIDALFETLFGPQQRRQLIEATADRFLEEAAKLVDAFRAEARLTEPEVKGLLKFQRWLREQQRS